MNKQQRDYAYHRVRRIGMEKRRKLEEKAELSSERKLEILRKSNLKVRPDLKEIRPHASLSGVVDWAAYIPKAQRDKAQKEMSALDKRVQEITDELYLGDCERALQLIKEFSNE